MLNKIRKSTWFLLIVIVITSMISIQGYKIYVSEPKIEIVNQFWSDYTGVYESALNATLETYCNDGATIMIQKHINEETNKLVKELKDFEN
jgi:cell shape-determining protein MreC